MPYEAELQAALQAADRASQAIIAQYADFKAIPNAPASITTDVDRLSQALILETLQAAFPNDAYCAEETTAGGGKVADTGPRLWVVDPIDGTRGFAMKNGEFSVMIAFLADNEVAVGVVAEPAKGLLTWAVRGGGCWRRDGAATSPTACKVTTVSELSASGLVQSRSKNPKEPGVEVRLIQPGRVVETYSAGIKLAMVARGDVEMYVNNYPNFHDWDIAAGDILVTEAGGKVTGLHGEPLKYGQPGAKQRFGLLGTNGKVHDAVIKKLESLK